MTEEIIEALVERIEEGKNILITGQAGVGKTFILNELLDFLKENEYNVGLAGSTGVAAINIQGTTIHRMLGINKCSSIDEFETLMNSEPALKSVFWSRVKEIKDLKILVIDEVSMIGASLLELMDHVLKKATKVKEPFGGKQIIFSGDFLQLPPIKDDYAFMSPVWKDAGFSVVHLTKVHRQDDPEFLEVLSKIRIGKYDDQVDSFIKKKIHTDNVLDTSTKLYPRNANVDAENERMLSSLEGKIMKYEGEGIGTYSDILTLTRNITAPEVLLLKVGAKVMSLKNADDLSYVNGSIGTVTRMRETWVEVKFENGVKEIFEDWTWTLRDDQGEVTASYSQIPLKLAYALTIHKSQGMTIDGELFIDCDGIRSEGQLYVALSRIKDHKKLKLVNFKKEYVWANTKAVSFYK